MDVSECPIYSKGHIYQFRDGLHRCDCGATMDFDILTRDWK